MGKANRIRNQRASTVLNPSAKPAKKKNQGMPSWAVNLIAIAITAFVVITIALIGEPRCRHNPKRRVMPHIMAEQLFIVGHIT